MSSHVKRIIVEKFEDNSYTVFNQTDNREICGLPDEKYMLDSLLNELRLEGDERLNVMRNVLIVTMGL